MSHLIESYSMVDINSGNLFCVRHQSTGVQDADFDIAKAVVRSILVNCSGCYSCYPSSKEQFESLMRSRGAHDGIVAVAASNYHSPKLKPLNLVYE